MIETDATSIIGRNGARFNICKAIAFLSDVFDLLDLNMPTLKQAYRLPGARLLSAPAHFDSG